MPRRARWYMGRFVMSSSSTITRPLSGLISQTIVRDSTSVHLRVVRSVADAYDSGWHTHPGPGIRCLLFGSIRIESGGETHEYGPFEPWFESGPEPVFAAASTTESSAFVRAMLLPGEWAGRRTIRYVDPADEDRPKLQRASVYFEHPL